MNSPLDILVASQYTRDLARSALPDAPVKPTPETRPPRTTRARGRAAAALRHVAARIEPACG
jgi:hypothetical protein